MGRNKRVELFVLVKKIMTRGNESRPCQDRKYLGSWREVSL